jgi:hypothetical protein
MPTYHTEYRTIPCIDTSGQTFAIWLNVLYLAPLTWLFVRFFIRSYLRRAGTSAKGKTGGGPERSGFAAEEKARVDALKGVEREVEKGTNGHAINGHNKSVKMNGNGKKH